MLKMGKANSVQCDPDEVTYAYNLKSCIVASAIDTCMHACGMLKAGAVGESYCVG